MHKILYFQNEQVIFWIMLYELHPEWRCITFNLKPHLHFYFCQFNCTSTPSEMGLKKAIDFRYLWRVDIGKRCLFYRQWNVFYYCILLNWYNYYSSSSTSVITPNSSNANPTSERSENVFSPMYFCC